MKKSLITLSVAALVAGTGAIIYKVNKKRKNKQACEHAACCSDTKKPVAD